MTELPALDLDILLRRTDFSMAVGLKLQPGERLAILGANGAGKSTLLAGIAGLLRPERGHIKVGGTTVFESGADGKVRVDVPTDRRRVGLLGQEPLLFPHLNASANVAFGPRADHVPRAQAGAEAKRWLTAVGLQTFENRKPHQLSGGQQQRVALARALAAGPKLVLLDEPFASMDVGAASHMRTLVAETLERGGMSAILVTHNVLDAITLAQRCLVLHEGEVIDEGPTERVLGEPRNALTAALTGKNLVEGTLERGRDGFQVAGIALVGVGDRAEDGDGGGRAEREALPDLANLADSNAAVRLVFAPRDAQLVPDTLDAPGSNVHRISTLEPSSDGVRVRFAESASSPGSAGSAGSPGSASSAGSSGSAGIGGSAVEVGAEAAMRLGLREGLQCRIRVPLGAARITAVLGDALLGEK